ncbi:MAG: glycoside hydrolase [Opitutaceae bacterium]|jgi:hypothetical protein|nr:glycoside hydrolase [Opitutaceae bacterium]
MPKEPNPDFTIVVSSPSPGDTWCYSPGLCRCPDGALIATMDFGGPGVARLDGPKSGNGDDKSVGNQGRIYRSEDGGRTWHLQALFPFYHARPFYAGKDNKTLYVLGHSHDLVIMRSDDNGRTWSAPATLTHDEVWSQAPCNVHYANGSVYLVMEKQLRFDAASWRSNGFGAILMRGRMDADLTRPEAWTCAQSFSLRDICPEQRIPFLGAPFFPVKDGPEGELAPGRRPWPLGWLESNVVQITDPDHYWYDPAGRTFHLLARAATNTTNLAALLKVVEHADGSMTTHLQETPCGEKMLYLPLPGGQMKFHILQDTCAPDSTNLYWLLSTQATDSMTRAERLPADRFNAPNDERQRLQLHYSKNCVDWCFASIVATGATQKQARHYASMAIDGDDLLILSRSGNEHAASAHNGNLITFHRVRNFRALAHFS